MNKKIIVGLAVLSLATVSGVSLAANSANGEKCTPITIKNDIGANKVLVFGKGQGGFPWVTNGNVIPCEGNAFNTNVGYGQQTTAKLSGTTGSTVVFAFNVIKKNEGHGRTACQAIYSFNQGAKATCYDTINNEISPNIKINSSVTNGGVLFVVTKK